jgi:DNA-binding winged helix-turn-helix (wHTH) protein
MTPVSKEFSQYTYFKFADFVLDPWRKELRCGGEVIELAPQPLAALIVLVANAEKLVLRETLKRAIWGDLINADVDDTLNHCVARLRRTLGDSARAPRYIATVARMGYRFVAEVASVRDSCVTLPKPYVATARGQRVFIEIARVRAQVKGVPLFCDGVVAATLRKIHTVLGEQVCAIDRLDSTTEAELTRGAYGVHIWVQHRQTCLRVSCHLTEPELRSVVQCAVFDVQVDEILDAHDAVADNLITHMLLPFLSD